MTLYRASTVVIGEGAALALRDALDLIDPAPLATEVHDHDDGTGQWDAGGLFDEPPDVVALAVLAEMYGVADFEIERVDDRDWVAQVRSELTPVEAGRFVVFGSHDRDRMPVNRIRLEIEAAQAFGTGHHASTQGCLTALDRLARAGFRAKRVADVGGGTAVLGMAASRLWPKASVRVGDIDPLATTTARENIAANGVGGRTLAFTAVGTRHDLFRSAAPYELVFANILATPLRRLAPEIAALQQSGGIAILSGILARQAPAVTATYRGWGYLPQGAVPIGEWRTLVLRRI